MITCGVDVGSLSAEAVLLSGEEILSYSVVRTGPDSARTAHEALGEALQRAGVVPGAIDYTVATGYGRVVVPFAQRHLSEITCHAKGAHHLFPQVRTILDMGGQDCKAVRCDPRGKVTAFLMNDKCAAGTGRALEVIAGLIQVPLEEIGARSLAFEGKPARISNTCVVFAKSEVLARMREGVSTEEILAALCEGVAERVAGLIRRVGLEEAFAITGGIAKNTGVVRRIEGMLGVQALIGAEPQIVGALGAALFARELLGKRDSA
jgi:benzoyl-CoA reductase subunit A